MVDNAAGSAPHPLKTILLPVLWCGRRLERVVTRASSVPADLTSSWVIPSSSASFTLIGSSESSRENSGKIFDRFSPPGPSWSPNSAPKAVLCSSARRAASSYPWPSPRRRIERFALGASRYTQIASLSTGEEFRCLSASANGPCARSSPSFSKVDERPRLARCCWKVV